MKKTEQNFLHKNYAGKGTILKGSLKGRIASIFKDKNRYFYLTKNLKRDYISIKNIDFGSKSVEESATNFSSNFMPNVKFKVRPDLIDTRVNEIGGRIITLSGFMFTDEKGIAWNTFDFKNLDMKQVSEYEAIPELVPEGMTYDKESDSLINSLGFGVEKSKVFFSKTEVSNSFSSRLMPNVKFKVLGHLCENNGVFKYTKKIAKTTYCYVSKDTIQWCIKSFYEAIDLKEVSIYEAIPGLVPPHHKYDKKTDTIVPDSLSESNAEYLDFKDVLKSISKVGNCTVKFFDETDNCKGISALLKAGTTFPLNNDAIGTPHYYGEKCTCGRKIDWYVIGDLYRKGKGSAWDHAMKKLLRAGEGHKPLLKDIDEVIISLNRWKEQISEQKS